MVKYCIALLLAAAAQAVPLVRRIDQVDSAATAKWEAACNTAGGGQQCNSLAVAASETLLVAAGACDQQNAADAFINLAKTLSNSTEMITLAQIFAQQPRNSPDSVSIPYCQQAPKNVELNGLFQCQFQGVSNTLFDQGLSVGELGTIPFGQSSPVNPPGSCPANPQGPVPAGQQLVDITTNPHASGESAAQDPASALVSKRAAPPAVRLSNGKEAQKLNAQFATLTASSPCTAGQTACIDGSLAQCVGNAFVLQSCGAALSCVALPLENSAGTSITCDTIADAEARIAGTGASGGLTGSAA